MRKYRFCGLKFDVIDAIFLSMILFGVCYLLYASFVISSLALFAVGLMYLSMFARTVYRLSDHYDRLSVLAVARFRVLATLVDMLIICFMCISVIVQGARNFSMVIIILGVLVTFSSVLLFFQYREYKRIRSESYGGQLYRGI
jgi:phosphatidylglycerophosphate synthase